MPADPQRSARSRRPCPHRQPCPAPDGLDREAARIVASHPEQGWSLLCNGVVLFEDTGELLPDGRVVAPHRPLRHALPAPVPA
ncbi:DUF5999 family protein [Actinomadura vinacea]|uniref:DUF5999 family protein n=1 Tax=Actinomadura vinacea TaxID=115336 RepID=UPI0031CE5D6B